MKETKNLLLTFDHELFLGANSGEIEKCIIGPTEKILSLLRKYDLNAVFFLDTLFFWKAEQQIGFETEFRQFKDQLLNILKNGHKIFPHIHPHWIDAIYKIENKTWDLSNSSLYRFSNLSHKQKEWGFEISMDIIKNLQNESKIFYPINAYRAGGWCIQPFSDFRPFFLKYHIKYDLSVIPLHQYKGNLQEYDFSHIVQNYPYQFEEDPNIISEDGQFTEIPISVIENKSKFIYLGNKINSFLRDRLKFRSFRYSGNGNIVTQNGFKKTQPHLTNLAFENLSWATINLYLNAIAKWKNTDPIHFISHTKTMTPHNFKMLRIMLFVLSKRFKLKSNSLD